MLALPEGLISGSTRSAQGLTTSPQAQIDGQLSAEVTRNPSLHSSSMSTGDRSSSFALRGQTGNMQQLRKMTTIFEVLKTLLNGKLICLCLDDVQEAEEESLELLASIISGNLPVVLIVSCPRLTPFVAIAFQLTVKD